MLLYSLSVLLYVTYYMLLYVTAIQLYAIRYTAICYYTYHPGHEAPAEWPMLHWALGSPPWNQNMDIVQICAVCNQQNCSFEQAENRDTPCLTVQ